MNTNATIESRSLEYPHVLSFIESIRHCEFGRLWILGSQLISNHFKISWNQHIWVFLISFWQRFSLLQTVEVANKFFKLCWTIHRIHLQSKRQWHIIKHVQAFIFTMCCKILEKQMLHRNHTMVLKVIYQLTCSKRVDKIKLYATRELLPLKIVQFVESTRFLPPWMSQLHTFAHNGAIIPRNNRILILWLLLIHFLVASGQDGRLFLLEHRAFFLHL